MRFREVALRRGLPPFLFGTVDVPLLGSVAERRAGALRDADATTEVGQAGVEWTACAVRLVKYLSGVRPVPVHTGPIRLPCSLRLRRQEADPRRTHAGPFARFVLT